MLLDHDFLSNAHRLKHRRKADIVNVKAEGQDAKYDIKLHRRHHIPYNVRRRGYDC